MDIEYKKILPEDVYVSILDEEQHACEPTGNNYIDAFVLLVRHYQHADAKFYAMKMNADPSHFGGAIYTLTGLFPKDWCVRYVMLSAYELLEKTDKSIKDVAKRCGFTSGTIFSRFFEQHAHMRPKIWRRQKRGIVKA